MLDRHVPRYLFYALCLTTALFAASAIRYWGGIEGLPSCAFRRPDCATALATYTLCLFTGAAFVAAYAAAIWTYRNYELERAPIVIVRSCSREHADHADRVLNYQVDVEEIMACEVRRTDTKQFSVDFEVVSFGRYPLLDADLEIVCRYPGKSKPLTRLLPPINLKTDESIHVRLYLAMEAVNEGATMEILKPKSPRRSSPEFRLVPLPPYRPYEFLFPFG